MTRHTDKLFAVTAALLLTLVTFYQAVTVPGAANIPALYEIA